MSVRPYNKKEVEEEEEEEDDGVEIRDMNLIVKADVQAGGLLRTTSRPTSDRRYTEIGTWVSTHRSVDHHEPCLRVRKSNYPGR